MIARYRRSGLGARPRRWLAAACIALVMAVVVTAFAWPVVVRHLVVSRLEGSRTATVRLDAVKVNPFTGRVADLTGLRSSRAMTRRLLAVVERFDARVRPARAAARASSRSPMPCWKARPVRIVRRADDFNVSDLFDRSGQAVSRCDVTVDRFVVTQRAP